MSHFDKLLQCIRVLDKNMHFEELQKVLEYYVYTMSDPASDEAINHSVRRVVHYHDPST